MPLNLADLFESVADAVPDRLAVVCGSARLTYAELDRRANRLAHHLREAGVESGQHVGLHMRNRIEYVDALLACFKIRAVPVNVNYRYTATELEYLYVDAALTTIVTESEFVDVVAEAAASSPLLRRVGVYDAGTLPKFTDFALYDISAATSQAPANRRFPTRSDDDQLIIYTGGTTGMPKGVVWRHEDFYMAALAGGNRDGSPYRSPLELAEAAAANATPITVLIPAPLMHGAALYSLLSGLFAGNKEVLMRNYDPVEALSAIENERVQCMMIVGDAIARPLADAITQHGAEFDLSSLSVVGSGGALWSPSSKRDLHNLLPSVALRDSFGTSESGADGSLEFGQDGSVRIRNNPNMLVVDDELQPLRAGAPEAGYLARTGHVPLGYLGDEEKTARTFPVVNGVRMAVLGDMGRVDADGSIVLLGRGSMCINTGGEKVFPEEVEATLKSHPSVMDALVVGAAHERFGEQVTAVVELRDNAEAVPADDLIEHCRAGLAGYKIPRSIVFVPRVRRSPAGKADYRWAKATVADSATPTVSKP
ncbi:acyl-CoA synthetase [Prescottella equi]|uniref:acyl-CoA synthetase n=1 Tax=Rhodococcus hoagii TaxID=43767 RepID=UPI000A10902B|nr:acyl-CoA synthetase [Prescottella equi]ORL97717.1 acyl-CoA synthetase [Prescottella equi]